MLGVQTNIKSLLGELDQSPRAAAFEALSAQVKALVDLDITQTIKRIETSLSSLPSVAVALAAFKRATEDVDIAATAQALRAIAARGAPPDTTQMASDIGTLKQEVSGINESLKTLAGQTPTIAKIASEVTSVKDTVDKELLSDNARLRQQNVELLKQIAELKSAVASVPSEIEKHVGKEPKPLSKLRQLMRPNREARTPSPPPQHDTETVFTDTSPSRSQMRTSDAEDQTVKSTEKRVTATPSRSTLDSFKKRLHSNPSSPQKPRKSSKSDKNTLRPNYPFKDVVSRRFSVAQASVPVQDYVSPNHGGTTAQKYIIIDVSSEQYLRNSCLAEDIKANIIKKPWYTTTEDMKKDEHSFESKLAACLARDQFPGKANVSARCFTHEVQRGACDTANKGRWSWPEQFKFEACTKCVYDADQCLMVRDMCTLVLVNPQPGDWDVQIKCDEENNIANAAGEGRLPARPPLEKPERMVSRRFAFGDSANDEESWSLLNSLGFNKASVKVRSMINRKHESLSVPLLDRFDDDEMMGSNKRKERRRTPISSQTYLPLREGEGQEQVEDEITQHEAAQDLEGPLPHRPRSIRSNHNYDLALD